MEDRFRNRCGSWEIQVWCSIDEKKNQKIKTCAKTRAPGQEMHVMQAVTVVIFWDGT